MTHSLLQKWRLLFPSPLTGARSFRSNAALEALTKASEEQTPNIVLYNYPSFSGAFSALFAHLFHSQVNLPCLILPFSSVEPLRVDDLCIEGLEKCYLLDFIGPKGFAAELSRRTFCEVIGFEHRESVISKIPSEEDCCSKLKFNFNMEKSSSTAAYEYFSAKFSEMKSNELLELSAINLVAKGNSYISSRQSAASKLLDKVFKVRLGRGFYGECLGVRVDPSLNLSDEIGRELSIKSAAAGLRPIGAVIYMQRNNLKMCLRSIDGTTDTSEVAKAYGGGGSSCSSSFIIRMDEYNQWLSTCSS